MRTPLATARYRVMGARVVLVGVAACFGEFRERGGRSRVAGGVQFEVPLVLWYHASRVFY